MSYDSLNHIIEKLNTKQADHTEDECFLIEAAMQHGFEMIGDEGDVFVCTCDDIIKLVRACGVVIERTKS